MGKYSQAFSFEVAAPPDAAFAALRRAVDGMDGATFGTADDSARSLEFSTGVTLTSWGERMKATVAESAGGSKVQVEGKPTGTFLTTKWGENVHGRTVEKRLRSGVDEALSNG